VLNDGNGDASEGARGWELGTGVVLHRTTALMPPLIPNPQSSGHQAPAPRYFSSIRPGEPMML
jgi:hypothetical protein